MKRSLRFVLPALGLMTAGCNLAPKYTRPQEPVPAAYAGQGPAAPGQAAFGDLPWFEVFHDPVLLDLVREALKENVDLKVAANRVLQTEVQVGVARSYLAPTVQTTLQGGRGVSTEDRALAGPAANPSTSYVVNMGVSYEIDFWGKLRNQTEVARANLLASQENQNLVRQSLVASVVQGYYQLRELDMELDLAWSTLRSREDSLRLENELYKYGVANLSDVRQAESLVQSVAHTIPLVEQSVAQQENALNVLLGRYQAEIPRGLSLDDQKLSVTVPPGLPSDLLENRPDIRMAEQNLVAGNAQIGVARASLFPSISLTAGGGYISDDLSRLTGPGKSIWNVGGNVVAPIFEGGRLREQVKLTELQKEELVLLYSKTVQQAFSETASALVSVGKTREARLQQETLVKTLEDELQLSNDRYRGGVAAYLEVQDAERQCFDGRRTLAQAKRDELLAVLSLYKALGGGWKTDAAAPAAN